MAADPAALIVHAGNDPIVLTPSGSLHTSTPRVIRRTSGQTRRTAEHPARPRAPRSAARSTWSGPSPSASASLHWLPPDYGCYAMIRTLTDAVPAGSALVVTHVTADFDARVSRIRGELRRDRFDGAHPDTSPDGALLRRPAAAGAGPRGPAALASRTGRYRAGGVRRCGTATCRSGAGVGLRPAAGAG